MRHEVLLTEDAQSDLEEIYDYIAEFDSLEDAENWAQADPYVAAGVYQSVTVEPFRKVLP